MKKHKKEKNKKTPKQKILADLTRYECAKSQRWALIL